MRYKHKSLNLFDFSKERACFNCENTLLHAILKVENTNKGTVRDSPDINSRHTELTCLNFSSIYTSVPFSNIRVAVFRVRIENKNNKPI